MGTIKLKVAELRKKKQISQQELAGILGVSFQTISKWETGATLPDIMLLPSIAEYFEVTVDQLLGLKPLSEQQYLPRSTDNRDNWNSQSDKFHISRKYLWNDDYLKFLVENVWKIHDPIDIIDFRCGDGYLGMKLLKLLPKGSSYTGIDNEYYIKKAQEKYSNNNEKVNFIVSDLYEPKIDKNYDMVILQVGLRHMNQPLKVLSNMVECAKENGIVVSIEVNREIENIGFYFNGMNYEYLCTAFNFRKLWHKELEEEGRDYAIGMRIPFYMQQLGLKDIDVRMNDKVMYVNPDMENYQQYLEDYLVVNGWNKMLDKEEQERVIDLFMNRGNTRSEAEAYVNMQVAITNYFLEADEKRSFLKVPGMMITYGRKL